VRELGTLVGRNSGVISRYETADRTPKPEHVAQILTALDICGEEYEEILSLAYDTDARRWTPAALADYHQHVAAMVEMEQAAGRIDHLSHSLFPGMLQSKAYATAIMTGAGIPAGEIVTRVTIRMGRRDALQRPDPVEFFSFVGEATLYWMIGGRDVMIDQLRHVLKLAQLPNVHLQLVPFSSGWQPTLDGIFMVLDRTFVHIDSGSAAVFLHDPADISSYVGAAAQVRDVAYGEAETKAALARRLRELERPRDREWRLADGDSGRRAGQQEA
jgi:hypothetical protein